MRPRRKDALSNGPLVDLVFFAAIIWSTVTMLRAISASSYAGQPFAAHPQFAMAGFACIASSGYLMRGGSRSSRLRTIHQWLNIGGTLALWYAFWAVWGVKETYGKPHIQTTHAYVSVAALALVTLLSVGTTVAVNVISDAKERAAALGRHLIVGTVALVLLALAVVSGAQSFLIKHALTLSGVIIPVAAAVVIIFVAPFIK